MTTKKHSVWRPLLLANAVVSVPLNVIGLISLFRDRVNLNAFFSALASHYRSFAAVVYDHSLVLIFPNPPIWLIDYLPIAASFYFGLRVSAAYSGSGILGGAPSPVNFRNRLNQFLRATYPMTYTEDLGRIAVALIYVLIISMLVTKHFLLFLLSPLALIVWVLGRIALFGVLTCATLLYFALLLIWIASAFLLFAWAYLCIGVGWVAIGADRASVLHRLRMTEKSRKLTIRIIISRTAEPTDELLRLGFNSLLEATKLGALVRMLPLIGYQYIVVAATLLILATCLGLNAAMQ